MGNPRDVMRAIRISRKRVYGGKRGEFGLWGWLAMACFLSSPVATWYLYHTEKYRPPVGVYIAIVGGLAASVTLRSEPAKIEKALWILTITVLVVAEIAGLYKADSEQKQQFATITTGLQTSVSALNTTISENRTHFDETMGGISREIDTFTGDHSYLVLYYVPGQGYLMFAQRGDYSVFDAQARITDLDAPMTPPNMMGTTVSVGEVTKGRAAMESVPPELNERRDGVNLNVFFTARNGGWTEQLRTRRTKEGWTYAIRVQGIFSDLKKSYIACESVGKDFPRETLDKDFKTFPLDSKLPACWP